MTTLKTETEINAPKRLVWQALTVKQKWHHWNTFLFDCDAQKPFQPWEEVFLALRRLPREHKTEFQARVTLLQPEICLRWVSSIPGFRNQSIFELQEIDFRRTKYVHQSRFYGWLEPIFLPFIRKDELTGMRRMARELKHYTESL